MSRFGRGTVECYDCHADVADLKSHRRACPGKAGGGRKGTVECYDCHQQVADLKAHRNGGACGKKKLSGKQSRHAHPVQPAANAKQTGIDVFVTLDVSDSMTGARLAAAKEAILDLHVNTLEEHDRLSLITFDTKAFFKLKPRPNGELARKKEIEPLLDRIFARGATAFYDALWMALQQIQDRSRPTRIFALSDGEDNSSTHTMAEVLKLAKDYPAVTLDIVYINDASVVAPAAYRQLVDEYRGAVKVVTTTKIVETVKVFFE
jgi:Mg-chelatase subunit ChlD